MTIKQLIYPYIIIRKFLKQNRNFYLINYRALNSGKIILIDKPSFNQRTIISGSGIVEIGKNCSFGYKLGGNHFGGAIEFQPRYKKSKIEIGNNVSTNNNLFICSANKISIDDDCLIGNFVSIRDFDAHNIDPLKRNKLGEIGEVIIGKNVWLGNNVIILKNTKIGDNSIIAAGAVVSGIIEENVIAGGIPAKVIKRI